MTGGVQTGHQLRADEILSRWDLRAAERGLDPGPPAFTRQLLVGGDRRGLFDATAVALILDRLEGAARRRHERWRIRQLDNGLALVHDPAGARSSIRVPAELRHLADLERRAVILADVDRSLRTEPDVTLDRLAIRWAVGARTLARWRAETDCQTRPEMAVSAPESSARLGA